MRETLAIPSIHSLLSFTMWGQAFGPAAGLWPGARERKLLGRSGEPCFNRVPFDVGLYPLGACVVRDRVVVTFVLPEGCSMQAKHADGFVSGEAFEWPEPLSGKHARGHK